MATEKTTKRASFWGPLAGLALVLVGGLGFCLSGEHSASTALHSLFEAIAIAGVLTLAVDPFLKRRLAKEASLDIFHHLLGFGLPPEIQERLKEIVLNTKVYRKDMEITCAFGTRENGRVGIQFEYKFFVVNPSHRRAEFHQVLKFFKQENPKIISVQCSGGKASYGKSLALKEMEGDDPIGWEGPLVWIPPERDGKNIWFRAEYSIERGMDDFHFQFFTQPTIGVTLRIKNKPANMDFRTSPATKEMPNEWYFDQVFMPGDKISMWWEEVHPQRT